MDKPATPSAKRTMSGKPKNATPNGHGQASEDRGEDVDFLNTPSKKIKVETPNAADSGMDDE